MKFNLKTCVFLLLSCALNAQEQASRSSLPSPEISTTTSVKGASSISPSMKLVLNNSVGAGTFLSEIERNEQFTSSMTITPSLTFKNIYAERNLKISGEQGINFNWLPAQAVSTVGFNDFIIRAAIKDAFFPTSNGLSLTPSVEIETPISKSSRAAKRFVGLSTALLLSWSKYGISLSYKSLLTGYINGFLPMPSCSETNEACPPSVRQTRLMLKNTIIAKYSLGNHSLSLTFRLYDAFLRPLPDKDGRLEKNLKESTLGVVEYSYAIPMRFPLALTFGVSSFQPSRDAKGAINFPFFDFVTPAKNNSQIFFEMDLGLS